MFVNDYIIVDIEDRSAQSITTRPINEQLIQVADGQDRLYPVSEQEIKISVVSPSDSTSFLGILWETPVQFTDALYGAMIPNTAEFAKGQTFDEKVNVFDQNGAGNFVNVDILVYTGPYTEESTEAETHYVGGTISEDGVVSVLEKDEHTLIKQQEFPAGTYQMTIPYRSEVDVIAKSDVDGEVLGHGNVVPQVIVP